LIFGKGIVTYDIILLDKGNIILRFYTLFIDFVLREWLLFLSTIGLIITTIYAKHIPHYSIQDLVIIFILLILFIVVNGLQKSDLILKISQFIENGGAIALKLVLTTFFLSMFITNDVALIVIVPLTLALNINKKGIIIILEALSANSGSALTPIGNPQNLFIYWFYNVPIDRFIVTIAPFSLLFLVLLITISMTIKTKVAIIQQDIITVKKKAYIYIVLLIIVLLAVLHAIPIYMGFTVILFAIFFDKKALKIDYSLLLSFLFFFGISDNLEIILNPEIINLKHIFLYSALTSQVISNVPTTLLFAKFTTNWEALLWGANSGGFGSLFGSLANLIAYKLYISHPSTKDKLAFTIKFFIMGYISLFISIMIY